MGVAGGATVTIADSTVKSPTENGMKVEGGTATITSCSITDAGESGFVLVGGTSVLSGNTVTAATEYGAECILSSVDLCFDDAAWEIDDTELAICAFGT